MISTRSVPKDTTIKFIDVKLTDSLAIKNHINLIVTKSIKMSGFIKRV